jgi:hypothetical protein
MANTQRSTQLYHANVDIRVLKVPDKVEIGAISVANRYKNDEKEQAVIKGKSEMKSRNSYIR